MAWLRGEDFRGEKRQGAPFLCSGMIVELSARGRHAWCYATSLHNSSSSLPAGWLTGLNYLSSTRSLVLLRLSIRRLLVCLLTRFRCPSFMLLPALLKMANRRYMDLLGVAAVIRELCMIQAKGGVNERA